MNRHSRYLVKVHLDSFLQFHYFLSFVEIKEDVERPRAGFDVAGQWLKEKLARALLEAHEGMEQRFQVDVICTEHEVRVCGGLSAVDVVFEVTEVVHLQGRECFP